MNPNNQYLGKVEGGHFKLLLPVSEAGTCRRLTSMAMKAEQPPELQELHLDEYEGRLVMVSGHADAEWIWSAEMLEVAGLILTAVVDLLLEEAVKPEVMVY
ncbi:MAG: hypothetical protein J7641_02345 [Cyanobacteria bacterium SID2]|nr:hypothetical protein [Cyanobacteria bacterium SID2]MBP0003777.1 hypothetical protein [Cyanobacteria bacterium SBC]